MVLNSSDEDFIKGLVDDHFAAQEAAAGINQKQTCNSNKCNGKKVVHRTCGSCKEIRCKDCNLHLQCPGCDKWFCEKDCCANGSSVGLYYCNNCGVICSSCITFLYEDFTLMDSCCDVCKKRIPPFYSLIKKKEGKSEED